ncbi:Hint domain-containing protein, partial [Methylobacterium sp. J-090]|uniref:Hint domain-containing protein n=1 Tax=Methylobacterium sp. J-090 TaxID=2836666 RepID=UPI001FB89356
MASSSSPVFKNFVEMNPYTSSTFRVGSVFTEEGGFTFSDAASDGGGDNTSSLGDVKNEGVTVTQPGGSPSRTDLTYWGKLGDDGVVVRFPSPRSNDGFTYILYTNREFKAFDEVPRSTFDQSPFALCFVAGTRILTARGEVAVEDLRVGDSAITASGRRRTVTWTGHR